MALPSDPRGFAAGAAEAQPHTHNEVGKPEAFRKGSGRATTDEFSLSLTALLPMAAYFLTYQKPTHRTVWGVTASNADKVGATRTVPLSS